MDVLAINVLFLTQSVSVNVHVLSIEQNLTLTEEITKNIHPVTASSILYFSESLTGNKSVAVGVSQALGFIEDGQPRVDIVESSSYVYIWGEALHETQFPLVLQSFTITETVEVANCSAVFDLLEITETVDIEIYYAPEIADTLVITSKASVYKPNKCWVNGDFSVLGP